MGLTLWVSPSSEYFCHCHRWSRSSSPGDSLDTVSIPFSMVVDTGVSILLALFLPLSLTVTTLWESPFYPLLVVVTVHDIDSLNSIIFLSSSGHCHSVWPRHCEYQYSGHWVFLSASYMSMVIFVIFINYDQVSDLAGNERLQDCLLQAANNIFSPFFTLLFLQCWFPR